jgi:two-component system nitrogen regulation sensor histidine kinase GlnL
MRPLPSLLDPFAIGQTSDPGAILASLPVAVVVLDGRDRIRDLNPAAEQLLQGGRTQLCGAPFVEIVSADNPIYALIEAARNGNSSVTEYGITLDGPKLGRPVVSVQGSPVAERPGDVVLAIAELSLTAKIDRQLTHRHAARSVSAMAAMLAHEVKNPLSGIRGAAQLLEQTVGSADKELTRLICDEVDRIRSLVDRMDVFSDARPIVREPVNIHLVLERVRRVAQNGFARHVRFIESYDPSLPPVFGNHDLLVQVFLNLVKNAAEAVPEEGGEITLSTAYQHGIRLAVRGGEHSLHLPLVVSVKDNGGGIPEDLRMHLFDPFVTTKRNGTGLGLALVAKIIGDHGGVVEFDSQARRTVFRALLPVVGREVNV